MEELRARLQLSTREASGLLSELGPVETHHQRVGRIDLAGETTALQA